MILVLTKPVRGLLSKLLYYCPSKKIFMGHLIFFLLAKSFQPVRDVYCKAKSDPHCLDCLMALKSAFSLSPHNCRMVKSLKLVKRLVKMCLSVYCVFYFIWFWLVYGQNKTNLLSKKQCQIHLEMSPYIMVRVKMPLETSYSI